MMMPEQADKCLNSYNFVFSSSIQLLLLQFKSTILILVPN